MIYDFKLSKHPGIGVQPTADGCINAHQFAFTLPIERFRPAVSQQATVYGTHYMTNNLRIHIVLNLVCNRESTDSVRAGVRIPVDIREPIYVAHGYQILRLPAPKDSFPCGHVF